MSKIKVMIVDDSAVVRQMLGAMIGESRDLELLGTAADPIFAMKKMEAEWPDVIILDIEMPRMDGITFLRKLMKERPTPVVICSALTERSGRLGLQALAEGAVDVIPKPAVGVKDFLEESSQIFLQSIRSAMQASLPGVKKPTSSTQPFFPASDSKTKKRPTSPALIAIGASAGGTRALETIMPRFPENSPPIVIVQHMPEVFTAMFAHRLDELCRVQVREAKNGDKLEPGLVLIAPGDKHLTLDLGTSGLIVLTREGPRINLSRPSVDVFFRSVAKHVRDRALGVILTGMGEDGALGMAEMHTAGAWNVAQDEESCLVFGMPAAAIKRKAVDQVLPLDKIPGAILGHKMV